MKCPACGGADLTPGLKVIKSVYKDDTIEVKVSGQHCPACGESILDSESSARYMAAMKNQRIRVDGEHESNRTFIRTVRVKLGLTQREAGELFGGGPNAFSRYERGHTRPPQALLQAFRMLDADPQNAEYLDGYQAPVEEGFPNESLSLTMGLRKINKPYQGLRAEDMEAWRFYEPNSKRKIPFPNPTATLSGTIKDAAVSGFSEEKQISESLKLLNERLRSYLEHGLISAELAQKALDVRDVFGSLFAQHHQYHNAHIGVNEEIPSYLTNSQKKRIPHG